MVNLIKTLNYLVNAIDHILPDKKNMKIQITNNYNSVINYEPYARKVHATNQYGEIGQRII